MATLAALENAFGMWNQMSRISLGKIKLRVWGSLYSASVMLQKSCSSDTYLTCPHLPLIAVAVWEAMHADQALSWAAMASSDFEAAILHGIHSLGYEDIREKQSEVVESFLNGHDVFGVLPTGYGKSLCYACLPAVFDYLRKPKDPSIVVVVTPLVAIMKDQVCSVNACITACSVCLYRKGTNLVKTGAVGGRHHQGLTQFCEGRCYGRLLSIGFFHP